MINLYWIVPLLCIIVPAIVVFGPMLMDDRRIRRRLNTAAEKPSSRAHYDKIREDRER